MSAWVGARLDAIKSRHIRRFPVVHQVGALDCGPACLEMIARFHHRSYSREFIRNLCPVDRQGSSLASLAGAAKQLGFKSLALKVPLEAFKERSLFPCIAYLGVGHFVVIYGMGRNRIRIADPSVGLLSYSVDEFKQAWLGQADGVDRGFILKLEPGPTLLPSNSDAEPIRPRDSLWQPFWHDVRPHLLPIGVGAAFSLAIQFILPFLAASLVDGGILPKKLGMVYIVILAELVLLLSRLLVEGIQSLIIAHIGLRTDVRLVSAFLIKLCKLPLSFFERRRIGELFQRITDHESIRQFLTESLSTAILSVLSLAVLGAVLAEFQPLLFVIFLIGSIAYLVYCALFFKYERILNHKNFQLSARQNGLIVEFLSAMQEIKLNNAEGRQHRQWEIARRSQIGTRLKAETMMRIQTVGGMTLNELKNLTITLIVAKDVIAGRMSLGTMVAIQAIVGQLSWPLSQIAILMSKAQDAILTHERACEIHSLKDEEDLQMQVIVNPTFDITLRNVSFSYGATTPVSVLRNISLTIPNGKTTAVVGKTGSGKTTIVRLLLKFYPATAGVILIGDHDIQHISHRSWRSLCGVVLQDGCLFSDTILNNIAIGDSAPNVDRACEVAEIAQIRTFIESLPLKYNTRVGPDGVGISRGQAQRILIARALYRNPPYLFLDEATSALDTQTERSVLEALGTTMQNRTIVIVAHRMSTVRNADQVVVIDGGQIAEVGSHATLLNRKLKYFELVRDQLSRSS